MREPSASQPLFPTGYLVGPTTLLPWSHVEQRLRDALNYWVCTVRPTGRPHTIPKWAVWVNRCIYFDGSPATRHAKNIATNPSVTVHLESGDDVVIVEGYATALTTPDPAVAAQVAAEYRRKYAAKGYAPEPAQWDAGGLFVVEPKTVLAWTVFHENPTKFEWKD